MSIKKLTAAAAIAVGIATCSLNSAIAACPCTQNESLPVVTGPSDCAKQKCKKVKSDCKKKKACPVKTPCNDEISCDKPSVPSTALCPQSDKPDSSQMKQVYGYPQAIYGTNNYVGESGNSIFSTETAMKGCPTSRLSSDIAGTIISSQTKTQITGAAASMPCLNECPKCNNTISESSRENKGCSVDIKTSNSINAVKKSLVPYTIKENITGAAAPAFTGGMFPDVPNGYWASCDIDKLAINNVRASPRAPWSWS